MKNDINFLNVGDVSVWHVLLLIGIIISMFSSDLAAVVGFSFLLTYVSLVRFK